MSPPSPPEPSETPSSILGIETEMTTVVNEKMESPAKKWVHFN